MLLSVLSEIIFLFQLRDQTVRFLALLAVAPTGSSEAVVHAAVLHVSVLYQFQHKFPAVLHVRNNLPPLSVAAYQEQPEEFNTLPL